MQTTPRSDELSEAEVYVLGSGRGESIVIRIKREGTADVWGVIDCCADSNIDPEKNATLRFLRRLEVTRVEFVCLTHPHEDHCRGLHHLLEAEELEVGCVFMYAATCAEFLTKLYNETAEQTKKAREKAGDGESTGGGDAGVEGVSRHFTALRSCLNNKLEEGYCEEDHVAPGKCVFPCLKGTRRERDPIDSVAIVALGPETSALHEYCRRVKGVTDDAGNTVVATARENLNLLSSSFILVGKGSSALLAGDVLDYAWTRIVPRWKDGLSECELVKVAHHGSMGSMGIEAELWRTIGDRGRNRVMGVIAPKFGSKLPRPEAVDYLLGQGARVFVTHVTPQIESYVREDSNGLEEEVETLMALVRQASEVSVATGDEVPGDGVDTKVWGSLRGARRPAEAEGDGFICGFRLFEGKGWLPFKVSAPAVELLERETAG